MAKPQNPGKPDKPGKPDHTGRPDDKPAKGPVWGTDGKDNLKGGDGNDKIRAGAGDDVLDGGKGSDVLFGGAGNDKMTGGEGADVFVFQRVKGTVQHDVITDFNFAAGDRLALHGKHDYKVSTNSAGNAVITVFDGDTIELVGVKAADVAKSWFDLGS